MSSWRDPHWHIIQGLSRRRLTGFNRFPSRGTAERSRNEQKTRLLDSVLYSVVECTDLCQPMVFNGEPGELDNQPPDWLILDDLLPPLMVSNTDPSDIREVQPGQTVEGAWGVTLEATPEDRAAFGDDPDVATSPTVEAPSTETGPIEFSSSSTDYGTDTSSSTDSSSPSSE